MKMVAGLSLLSWVTLAQGIAITVDVADTSSLEVTNVSTIFGSDPIFTPELISTSTFLDENSTETIELFSLTIDTSWFSLGTFDITATLDFLSPDLNDVIFTDTTSFYIASGTFVDGVINWDQTVQEFAVDDSIFQIELLDINLFDTYWTDNTIVISATLTNIASVPEPSTILLIGTGLLGVGLASLRKKT
jgi:hypothetical protein